MHDLKHGSHNGNYTICGKELNDGMWSITNNSFNGIINVCQY